MDDVFRFIFARDYNFWTTCFVILGFFTPRKGSARVHPLSCVRSPRQSPSPPADALGFLGNLLEVHHLVLLRVHVPRAGFPAPPSPRPSYLSTARFRPPPWRIARGVSSPRRTARWPPDVRLCHRLLGRAPVRARAMCAHMPSNMYACSFREMRLKSLTRSFRHLSARAYKSSCAPRCSFATRRSAAPALLGAPRRAACASARHTSRMVSAMDASSSFGRSPGSESCNGGRTVSAQCLYRPAAARRRVAIAGADSPSTNPGDSGVPFEPSGTRRMVGLDPREERVSSTDPPTTTSRSSSRSCLAGPTTARGRSSTATTASWRFAAARGTSTPSPPRA